MNKQKQSKDVHVCSICGTIERILKGVHWDELHIPAGFYCPKCQYLTYTVWGGYGMGAPEGRKILNHELKEFELRLV